MAETRDVFEVLDRAIEIEMKAAELYKIFSKKFAENEIARYLWSTLSSEEEGHADFLRSEKKMIKTAPASFGTEAMVDLSFFDGAIETIDTFIERANDKNTTLKDALCMAIRLESMMVEEEYGELVEILSPGLKKVFKEITDKSKHLDKVRSAATALGVNCSEDD